MKISFGNDRVAVLERALELATDEIKRLHTKPTLINIERDGRTNKFTFVRGEAVHIVETYGTMGDDLAGWKRALLEDN